jgi:flavin-dependent dehydrogenase
VKIKEIEPKYDIVVVGSSISGCTVANLLSKELKVLLVDCDGVNRSKPCGGILVEESQNVLKRKGWLPESIFARPKYLDLAYIDCNNKLRLETKRNFWNIYRKRFDKWLRSNCAVEPLLNTRVLSFQQETRFIQVNFERNGKPVSTKCDHLVGADGSLSVVRKQLDEERAHTLRYVAVQEWIKSNVDIGSFLYFIYDNRITDFFSWLIPKNEFIIVGSALQRGKRTEKFELLKDFVRNEMNIREEPSKKEAHAICRPKSDNQIFLGQDNILLVGEAAGLISPSTGEGISFALRSGEQCARALNTNLTNALQEYVRLCKPLVCEIVSKIHKAEVLSNQKTRANMLRREKQML